jgi:hypothetical protein
MFAAMHRGAANRRGGIGRQDLRGDEPIAEDADRGEVLFDGRTDPRWVRM